jgi:hypothetical protein
MRSYNMRMLSMRISIENSNILTNSKKNENRSRSVFYGLVRLDLCKKTPSKISRLGTFKNLEGMLTKEPIKFRESEE